MILVVNALKRAEILPLTPATQLAAPLAQLLAIGLITALFAAVRSMHGKLGSIGVVLYVGSLVGLVGVEFVINLVFPYVAADAIPTLLAGPLGIAFTVASVSFLLGSILFFAALWRVKGAPKVALVIAMVSSIPIALRMAFPELVLQIALVGLAVGIVLLTVWLVKRTSGAPELAQ
ncbi:hypothetical protein [Cryobacterium sp. W22_MBD10_FK3]|uniref:hypothetical protein n=1 Tax=Cryobacterium sp. W22_MBD10_FK3 TaxID=3240273 RepID=UPI003F8E4AD9